MSQNNKQKKKEKTREDYLEDLRKLGVRETTHEKEGITKITLRYPYNQIPQPEGGRSNAPATRNVWKLFCLGFVVL